MHVLSYTPGQQHLLHLLFLENNLQQYVMVESGLNIFFLVPSRLRPRSAFLVSDTAVFRKTFIFNGELSLRDLAASSRKITSKLQ
jgi:hypothetical protein